LLFICASRPAASILHRRQGLAVLVAAALLVGGAPGAVGAAPDTTAPSVKVSSPTGGSTVAGTVMLKAIASDNVGVKQVRWYVDGVEVARDEAAGWSRAWSSRSKSSGTHQIYARAVDAAGNWGTSAKQTFTIRSIKGWPLVMSDTFNGSAVDSTKWSIYGPWIPGHNGNGVRDGSAVRVADGLLTITARMVNGTLVSGGMSNRLDQTYGFYEFRVRTDADPTLVTSGVVLTWPQSGRWPIDGENDIYETGLDADRKPIASFIHYGADNRQYWFHHSGATGTAWHTMAMEWDSTAIRIYRDGILAWTVTDRNAIPDVAHHLTVQLDAFKKSMTGTVRLQVAWVRIYKRP
jgi:beta-glucanase (GH16 family)